MKRFAVVIGLALGALAAWFNHKPVTVYAQTLPVTVKVGVTPDASGNTGGYTTSLDGAAAVDQGLPATNPSCVPFNGGAASPCIVLPVTVGSLGSHTVSVVAYNGWGNSSPATVTFVVAVPSAPTGVHVVR